MTTPSVDRSALRNFICGSPVAGQYPDAQWGQWEERRRALLAECRARGVTVHLTGSTAASAQAHGPVPTILADIAAQCSERWPDPTRADGMAWSLPEAIEQVALCCAALDAADNPAPSGGGTSGWKALPVLTSAAASSDTSSFQSAVPSWTADGMVVALPAKGDKPGTPNPTSGTSTQRCEVHLKGWESLTETLFLRYDFSLAAGFPASTTDWQVIAQLKNSSTGSPPLEVIVNRGQVNLQWHDKAGNETGREVLGTATTGVKHSVVLQVPFTTGSSATVTGWLDGVQAFSASHGPTLYPSQTSEGKLGIYRSNAIGVAATITHHGVAKGSTFASVTA